MKPEKYDQWNAQMADYAPGQITVERGVYWEIFDLLHLEYADHPQR
jgi:hypothetical protein